jgi:hypothetical protein
VLWGLVFGGLQAASPLAFRWLDPATVHALSITLIASVDIGFAVADGRPGIIVVEIMVAGPFVVLAATAATGTPWLLVLGDADHGIKDLWQERPLRCQHQVVAPVLRRHRLARCRHPRCRGRRCANFHY